MTARDDEQTKGGGGQTVRLDKWLQVARVFKTRSQATRACTQGRVQVNGRPAKPPKTLALQDRVEVRFGEWVRVLIVKELRQKVLPKALALRLFEDLSPPRPSRDPIDRILGRERGSGRPTKKDRRAIRRLKEGN